MGEQKSKKTEVTELLSKEDEALFPTGPIVQTKPWIRGVNIGGWLVLERYISPYFFALTNCHVQGDFRFYPGQIDAPPVTSPLYKPMNTTECTPLQPSYPVDMYTLFQAFGANEEIAKQWLNVHYENFVTQQDIIKLKEAGVLYVRVPIPHWILESSETVQEEPWVAHDGAWTHFKKLCGWCRELGIQVWPDVHTAPGSQNGFDNSGQALPWSTCHGWDQNPAHIQRSLDAIRLISQQLVDDGLTDVVTGLGLLNEPFVDCDIHVLQDFYNRGFAIVRDIVGPDMAVYIGDMFRSHRWDNGFWTNDPKHDKPFVQQQQQHDHELTFLDSHFYHVFDPNPRALSPRQHIAFVCRNQYRETVACCYEDKNDDDIISVEPEDKHAFMTGTVSKGISHIVGEWSAAFDTLVTTKLDIVMDGIAQTGIAPEFDRQIPELRQKFLRNFVEAQMVTYEAATTGVSRGWFYWTLKMEGGVFGEWNFLKGLEEGWIPPIPPPHVPSVDLYGSCYDIIFRTDDSMSIVDTFPAHIGRNDWPGEPIDDDVVVSHGQSLLYPEDWRVRSWATRVNTIASLVVVALLCTITMARSYARQQKKRSGYSELKEPVKQSVLELSV